MKAVIMAGGGGTRLWPESRKNSPKQTQPFTDDQTLLQKTYNRLLNKFDISDIWVTTGYQHESLIKTQLPNHPTTQYSIEPERRDTAAAIALINLKLNHLYPESSMININSDAHIANEDKFIESINIIEQTLKIHPDYLIGIGITPNYPETGYGYIKKGNTLEKINGEEVRTVDKFVEKPNLETAKKYLESGKYLWNPTLFSWKTQTMMELFEEFSPGIYQKLMEIKPFLGTKKEADSIAKIYPTIDKTSIDYAIFEKAPNMAVLEANFGWSDVGSWSAVKDIQSKNTNMNVYKGDVHQIDCSNCLIYGTKGKFITTIGLKDTIVVDTDNAILICKKDRSQDVKKVVKWLEENKRIDLL